MARRYQKSAMSSDVEDMYPFGEYSPQDWDRPHTARQEEAAVSAWDDDNNQKENGSRSVRFLDANDNLGKNHASAVSRKSTGVAGKQ